MLPLCALIWWIPRSHGVSPSLRGVPSRCAAPLFRIPVPIPGTGAPRGSGSHLRAPFRWPARFPRHTGGSAVGTCQPPDRDNHYENNSSGIVYKNAQTMRYSWSSPASAGPASPRRPLRSPRRPAAFSPVSHHGHQRPMPVLVVLDYFDDNLAAGPGRWTACDPALGCRLASSAGAPHPVRLLITGPRAGCRPSGFAAIGRYPSEIGANVIAAGPPCDPRALPFGERRSQSRRLTVRREDVGA